MIFWQAGFGLLIADMVLFFVVIGKIGFFKTILLMAASAVIGGFLVRAQGMATLLKARESFDRGTVPVSQMFESFCLLAAGALFILPGFISDIIAFALLIPMVQKTLKSKSGQAFAPKEESYKPAQDGVIEGQYERVEEPAERFPPHNQKL